MTKSLLCVNIIVQLLSMEVTNTLSIKKLRENSGLSQIELAKQLNVTQGAVSQWEVGMTKPSIETIIKLSVIFNCTTDELLGIEKTPTGSQA